MLKLKRHEIPQNGSINITPLIDVVLQLLIFLMLTSSLVKPNRIELDLPKSTSGVKASDKPFVTVTYRLLKGAPEIMLNSEQLADLDELNSRMQALRDSADDPQVDIRIERSVPYQEVISVIDSVRDAGVSKFSLHTLAGGRPRG